MANKFDTLNGHRMLKSMIHKMLSAKFDHFNQLIFESISDNGFDQIFKHSMRNLNDKYRNLGDL